MPMLTVRCGKCNGVIPTGVEMSYDTFRNATFVHRTVECPNYFFFSAAKTERSTSSRFQVCRCSQFGHSTVRCTKVAFLKVS